MKSEPLNSWGIVFLLVLLALPEVRQLADQVRIGENPEKFLEGGRIRTPLLCLGLGVEQLFLFCGREVVQVFVRAFVVEEVDVFRDARL